MEIIARFLLPLLIVSFFSVGCHTNLPPADLRVPTRHFLNTSAMDSFQIRLPDKSSVAVSEVSHREGLHQLRRDTVLLPATLENDAKIYYCLTVPVGTAQRLHWSDGVQATVDAGSTIKFTNSSNLEKRRFLLDGRAYIETTPGSRWQVTLPSWGTILLDGQGLFIDGFGDQGRIKVIAYGGDVRLTGSRFDVRLSNGEGVELRVDKSYSRLPGLYPRPSPDWTQNFRFTNLRLVDMTRELFRWYGQPVSVSGRDSTDRFTMGSLSRHDSLDSVCSMMSELLRCRFAPIAR
jgi:hypothetical protein